MSETLDSMRRKIGSANELASVVRTMKAIAASSITQYERAVLALDDYYRTVELGLVACLHQRGTTSRMEAETALKPGAPCAVVFGSDQGLVGQFNESLARFAIAQLGQLGGAQRVLAVGERVQGYFPDAGLAIAGTYAVPNSIAAVTSLIADILAGIEAQREYGKELQVYLFHNRPTSGALYEPVMQRLLPVNEAWRQELARQHWPTANLPEVLGAGAATLQALTREYLFISLFRACAESLASENASRLAAMQRAEKNIEELLEQLNQSFHRQRQSSIDEELFDVISGFEALADRR